MRYREVQLLHRIVLLGDTQQFTVHEYPSAAQPLGPIYNLSRVSYPQML